MLGFPAGLSNDKLMNGSGFALEQRPQWRINAIRMKGQEMFGYELACFSTDCAVITGKLNNRFSAHKGFHKI